MFGANGGGSIEMKGISGAVFLKTGKIEKITGGEADEKGYGKDNACFLIRKALIVWGGFWDR